MTMATLEHKILLDDALVPYTLRQRAGTRRLRLAVYADGALVVTAPKRLSRTRIEQFIREKATWVVERINHAQQSPQLLTSKHTPGQVARYKLQAFVLVENRIAHFNAHYGHTVGTITIRNQRTRWGSCSRQGNLNFTYKIALLPPELADYIIVHELCHLREFNHSPAFWKLVAQTVPNHRALRAKLKRL
jgi:predicted metal-dependent hydrolase